jgi:hypothetical protein
MIHVPDGAFEETVMPEQPKPKPQPEPTERERARAALQISMDRRG